jgi:RFX DNA-binding domain
MQSASMPFGQMMTVGMPARPPTLQVGPAAGVPILPAGPVPSAPQSSVPRPGMTTTVATNFVVGGDTEVIACNWLKAHFEYRAEVRAGISNSEVYRRYVGSCSAHGLRNVVNPAMFLSCVRFVTY